MKETMLTYIQKEYETNMRILQHRDEILAPFITWLKTKEYSHWEILATGSSANALTCATPYVEDIAKVRLSIHMPKTFASYPPIQREDEVYFAVSQSGHSTSTIEAIRTLSNPNDLFILTANKASPIVRENGTCIEIACGEEKVDLVTMGMSATIVTFMLMGLYAAKEWKRIDQTRFNEEIQKLKQTIEAIPSTLQQITTFFDRNKARFMEMSEVVVIGCGGGFGVAREAETKITETLYLPIHGYELEEYMHGPYLALQQTQTIFFIDSKDESIHHRMQALWKYVKKYNDHCFMIDMREENEQGIAFDEHIVEHMRVIIQVIFFQYLCDAITKAKGYDPMETIYEDFDSVLESKI